MPRENEGYGKLIHRGQPAESPSDATLEDRARELARIEGRREVTDLDRQRAHAELHGIGSRDEDDDPGIEESETARDPSEPARGRAGLIPRTESEDENEGAHVAALEGVEEAEHEQMLEASEITDPDDEETER